MEKEEEKNHGKQKANVAHSYRICIHINRSIGSEI